MQLVYAVNSPFDREVFKLAEVQRWVNSDRAKILEQKCPGEPLFIRFHDRFAMMIREQLRRSDAVLQEDKFYDRTIGGFTATWRGKMSGGMNVMQMEKQWPK